MPFTQNLKIRGQMLVLRGHDANPIACRSVRTRHHDGNEMKWRLLLPGASGPRLPELIPSGLQVRCFKPLTRPEQPEHSCRWQLWNGPLRRNHLGQKHVFYALVDPISAPLVEPPGTAPGSERFITTPVYHHSRPLRDGRVNIGGNGSRKKSGKPKTLRRDPIRPFWCYLRPGSTTQR